jgi:hypothetical protein
VYFVLQVLLLLSLPLVMAKVMDVMLLVIVGSGVDILV